MVTTKSVWIWGKPAGLRRYSLLARTAPSAPPAASSRGDPASLGKWEVKEGTGPSREELANHVATPGCQGGGCSHIVSTKRQGSVAKKEKKKYEGQEQSVPR